MNITRYFIASIVVFAFFWGFGFFWHNIVLMDIYGQFASLWRTQEEMQTNLHWIALNYAALALIISFMFAHKFEDEGIKEGCDVVIFPELAICGYPPDDLLDYPSFINQCIEAIEKVAVESKNITIILGGIDRNTNPIGRKLYNTAFVLANGKVVDRIHKTLLPTYDIFSERRYFEPNTEFKLIDVKGTKIAISICEDLWDRHNDFAYQHSPVEELAKLNPDIHINICASPFYQTKFADREKVILIHGVRYVSDLAYKTFIEETLHEHEYLGEMIANQLVYYPTVTREPFKNEGRITQLISNGQLAKDLDLPQMNPETDRAMVCGGPDMLSEIAELLDQHELSISPRIGYKGDYVIERAFVDK